MQHAAQKRAGRDDDGSGAVHGAAPAAHSLHCSSFDEQRLDRLLAQREAALRFQAALHFEAVGRLVSLRARRVHGRPFGRVQHPELDARGVNDLAHLAAESVYLAHKLPLGKATDGRVAAHVSYGVEVHGQEGCARAHARSGQRGFASRVACSDDYNVEILLHCASARWFRGNDSSHSTRSDARLQTLQTLPAGAAAA
jgi:hypothetical protein